MYRLYSEFAGRVRASRRPSYEAVLAHDIDSLASVISRILRDLDWEEGLEVDIPGSTANKYNMTRTLRPHHGQAGADGAYGSVKVYLHLFTYFVLTVVFS